MNAAGMSGLAKATFTANATPLAFQYKLPGDKRQYLQAFSIQEKAGIPVPGLFQSLSTVTYHTKTADKIGKLFAAYIDGITSAIGGGVDKWAKLATISNVQINAVAGVLAPGSLKGPPLKPLILASAPMATQMEQKYSKAIAQALSDAWNAWANGYSASLFYPPTFAVCPSPMHPPTPNIPIPLIAGASGGDGGMASGALSGAMKGNLGDAKALHHAQLFDAIGTGVSTMFLAWKASTQIMNVLGTGPVPTFAPPVVPMGPVVSGMGNGPPGCLVGPGSGGPNPLSGTPAEQKHQAQQWAKEAMQAALDMADFADSAGADAAKALARGEDPEKVLAEATAGFEREYEKNASKLESRRRLERDGDGSFNERYRDKGGKFQNREKWTAAEIEEEEKKRKKGKGKAGVGVDIYSDSVSADAWGDTKKFKHGELSASALRADGSASVGGKFGKGGVEGNAAVDAQVTLAQATAKGHYKGVNAEATVNAGTAKAGAAGSIGISKKHIGANLSGEAGAYLVEGSVAASKKVGIAEARAGATGSVGVGIGANADAGITKTKSGRRKVEVKASVKLVVGLGGKVDVGVSVPMPKASDAKKAAHATKKGLKKAWDWAT